MQREIKADFCVIGGGVSGLCAAVSAARSGLKVVLVHDRPVLGGNASSEIRMWIRGAGCDFHDMREGGIVEELAMDNIYYNPTMNYPVWDAVLYNKVKEEKNIELLLNATCNGAECKDNKIISVKAWQLTTYINYNIYADFFADCSGDSILAEFTNANYRIGRESADEFNERGAVKTADSNVMGMSCLLQSKETTREVEFKPLPFYKEFAENDFPYRFNVKNPTAFIGNNFWWVEKGGTRDTIREAEDIKHELLPSTYGIWNFIKNSGLFESSKWELDFVGHLEGKRESRRYEGEYILTQTDLEAAKEFDDEIAYGGWPMDDHDPDGMDTNKPPNTNYRVQKPYPIPYRVLYSSNIENLFFAGRNISATHMALSSTRVMATCAIMGQAVGIAASLAKKHKTNPSGVLKHINELKQNLRDNDCYLLSTPRKISDVIKNAKHNLTKENYANLLKGIEREINNTDSCMIFKKGEEVTFEFDKVHCLKIRLIFDNDIARKCSADNNLRQYPAKCSFGLNDEKAVMPQTLVKKYEVSIKINGVWQRIETKENHQRLNYIDINKEIEGIKFKGLEAYGNNDIRVYSIDIKQI